MAVDRVAHGTDSDRAHRARPSIRFYQRGALNVRFAPKVTEWLHCYEMTRWAMNRLMHRSKLYSYSMTSSARASIASGTLRPSVFAVRMFNTNSNFMGCSTGISAGRAPFRILYT